MICYNCGCRLSEKDFCTGCGAEVSLYKKIMYSANHMYNDGLQKASVRDLSGAISSLRQCLKLNKNHIDARNLLGLCYFERGEVVAALSEWVISKNIQGEKNIADDYINKIQSNPGRLENFNQTIKKYNQALAYCQQDSLDLAVIQLKKVISMNPSFVQAYQLIALLYINSEEWEKAKKELEKCIKIDTNNTTTLRYLKEVNEKMPHDEGKKKKEAIVYQSGNDTVIQPVTKKERRVFQTFCNIMIGVAIGVGVAWFLILRAKVAQTQEEAKLQFKEISEKLDEKTVQVEELTQQIENLKAEKDTLSDNLDAASGIEVAVKADTDLIEAARMYVTKSADPTEIAETLEMINKNYLENDAKEGFVELYNAILADVGPKIAATYYSKGYEAYRTEDYQGAIDNFTKTFEYDPSNGDALYLLGNAYNKSGNAANAVDIYKKVIELFPDTDKARKAERYIKQIQGE